MWNHFFVNQVQLLREFFYHLWINWTCQKWNDQSSFISIQPCYCDHIQIFFPTYVLTRLVSAAPQWLQNQYHNASSMAQTKKLVCLKGQQLIIWPISLHLPHMISQTRVIYVYIPPNLALSHCNIVNSCDNYFVVILEFSDSNIKNSNSVFDVFISPSRTFIISCGSNIKALRNINSYMSIFIYISLYILSDWISCKCSTYIIFLPSGVSLTFPNSYTKSINYSSDFFCLLFSFQHLDYMESHVILILFPRDIICIYWYMERIAWPSMLWNSEGCILDLWCRPCIWKCHLWISPSYDGGILYGTPPPPRGLCLWGRMDGWEVFLRRC